MFLDETIDPDIPTDPNELALYKRYGRNWRNVVMGSTGRDRGGNFDRGMRFMHTTPEGFMQRPSMQSMQQVQQSNIDQSGFFAQMQKLQDEYNQALQEYYSYMSTPQYDQMQDYYAGNYQDYYGGGGGSQDNPYVAPPPPALDPPLAAATDTMENLIGKQTDGLNYIKGPAAPIYNMVRPSLPTASPVASSNDRGGDRIVAPTAPAAPTQMVRPAPAAPAYVAPVQNMVRPTLDSFITRYDRPVVNTVRPDLPTASKPVTTVAKPATSFKKVKAM